MIGAVFDALAAGQARRRRARNLRAGQAHARPRARAEAMSRPSASTAPATAPALRMAAWGCALLALAGVAVIVLHARWLALATPDPAHDVPAALARLQPLLPGASFTVPSVPAARLERHGQATLLLVANLRAEPAQHIDLCSLMPDPARNRMLPLRIGERFTEVEHMAVRADGALLRQIVLADEAMPRITLSGTAAADFMRAGGQGLDLRWEGMAARWIGDAGAAQTGAAGALAGSAQLQRQGWLLWGSDRALRILRRPSAACARAGELVLQLFRPSPAALGAAPARALALAFPDAGEPLETTLAPGEYTVPASSPATLEDAQLFEQLRARGLLRLGAQGLVELAPPDLVAWRVAGGKAPGWDAVAIDATTRHLLERLYRHADGDFVREQVRIFNSERRLLAWRLALPEGGEQGAQAGVWQAEAGGAPAPLAQDLPAAATRLFARLPQGWDSWQRVAAWPGEGGQARLKLRLDAQAAPGATVKLMLAGRLLGVSGAALAAPPQPACSGRACTSPDEVQLLELRLAPESRELVLDAAPLGMDALASRGDARYRHLVLQDGRLRWQALPAALNGQGARAPTAAVQISDRHGRSLWHDGAPTEAAREAGLATLLGVQAGHANSVAGMLGRLSASGSGRIDARLTLDLDLQAAAQGALDCLGMRQGRWDGRACSGGVAPPAGRQAGMVVLDTETGEVLAMAGSGAGQVDAGNWQEARDFDRIDPAASPLRLPALQHDGGAERSPGSTFKIVSALGLELAAKQGDRELDALLDGRSLAEINRMAAAHGYAFRTDAPTYPLYQRARITNFRDQGLDRRAQDGKLGLAQALTYSLNTWFAWTGEWSDRGLFGKPEGGAPDLQPLAAGALDPVRPIVAMARKLGFGRPLRLDGGLLPADYAWSNWDALQGTPAAIDPVHTRHELRQMAIGLRMQVTPLQMALVAGAVGQGRTIVPRLLQRLDGRDAQAGQGEPLGVRLDRIRAGMKGVVDGGTAAGAFHGPGMQQIARGLYGKTGTAPLGVGDVATVWFTGWLEPDSLPGQAHRLALAVFVSQSESTGGGHAAPVAAAVLRAMQDRLQPAQGNENRNGG